MRLKIEQEKLTTTEVVQEARLEIAMLADEMRSWGDNMEGTGLENTMKFEAVSEVADELEELESTIEALESPQAYSAIEVAFTWSHPYGKSLGRSWRAVRIGTMLGALANILPENDETNDFIGECQDIADRLGNLDFPGMY